MSFFVYILYSSEHARTYVGQAEDLAARLHRHNAGYVRSTKAYRPWTLVHSERFETRSEAVAREEWLKTVAGRKLIVRIMDRLGGGLSDPAVAGSRSRSGRAGTD